MRYLSGICFLVFALAMLWVGCFIGSQVAQLDPHAWYLVPLGFTLFLSIFIPTVIGTFKLVRELFK